jgi:hypothetical protein
MDRTPAETPEGTDAEKHIPPCRLAGFYKAPCPLCSRQLTLKCLLYSHKCARSFDPAQRAREQQILADQAIKDRMTLLERLAERKAEQATDKKNKYAHLIQF